jgi:hypothetical protein
MEQGWIERAFAANGPGWPLVFAVGLAIAAYKFARWAGPLAQRLVDALIDFLKVLSGQLTRIETTGIETKSAIEDLTREIREDRLRRERGQ